MILGQNCVSESAFGPPDGLNAVLGQFKGAEQDKVDGKFEILKVLGRS